MLISLSTGLQVRSFLPHHSESPFFIRRITNSFRRDGYTVLNKESAFLISKPFTDASGTLHTLRLKLSDSGNDFDVSFEDGAKVSEDYECPFSNSHVIKKCVSSLQGELEDLSSVEFVNRRGLIEFKEFIELLKTTVIKLDLYD